MLLYVQELSLSPSPRLIEACVSKSMSLGHVCIKYVLISIGSKIREEAHDLVWSHSAPSPTVFSSIHPTPSRFLRLPQAAPTRRHLFQALPKSNSAFVVSHCCRKLSYCFRLLGAQSRSRAKICSAEICLAVVERICRSPSCQFCSTGQYDAFRMAATHDHSSLDTSASAQACTH